MLNIGERIKGRSFLWLFALCGSLALLPVASGGFFALDKSAGRLMFASSMVTPFILQAFSGYALDQWWTARYSRIENSRQYWSWLVVWGIGALAFVMYAFLNPHGGLVAA
jgi:hypothetical protein